jgi:hypothetical protein
MIIMLSKFKQSRDIIFTISSTLFFVCLIPGMILITRPDDIDHTSKDVLFNITEKNLIYSNCSRNNIVITCIIPTIQIKNDSIICIFEISNMNYYSKQYNLYSLINGYINDDNSCSMTETIYYKNAFEKVGFILLRICIVFFATAFLSSRKG